MKLNNNNGHFREKNYRCCDSVDTVVHVANVMNRKSHAGLTLIEVLIALAIIAIAMTAIIKATSQNIRGTHYLQEKTIAMWVSQQILNEARVGILKWPNVTDKLKGSTPMLGRDWYWQAAQEETPNKQIHKVEVSVYTREDAEDESTALITLEGYVYAKE